MWRCYFISVIYILINAVWTHFYQGNKGLKPKEGEVISHPWQWPINYRVSAFLYLQISVIFVRNFSCVIYLPFASLFKWLVHTHNRFTALFPGPPGWAGARRELLDFMVQGKINRGRHTDHPAGRHSVRTNQCQPPPSPFFTGRMPFLPPNQQCQSTEGNL